MTDHIEIETTKVRSIDWEKNGRKGTLHLQPALLFRADERHPDKFELPLPRSRNGQPYSPGVYDLTPTPTVRNERLNMGFQLTETA